MYDNAAAIRATAPPVPAATAVATATATAPATATAAAATDASVRAYLCASSLFAGTPSLPPAGGAAAPDLRGLVAELEALEAEEAALARQLEDVRRRRALVVASIGSAVAR